MRTFHYLTALFAVAALLTISCPVQAETIYGMRTTGSGSTLGGTSLIRFDSSSPSSFTTIGNFTGLLTGHLLREIDFRPFDGQLYAISTSGTTAQMYTVDLSTAALTPQGGTFTLTGATAGAGAIPSMDFNPAVDRLRIVTRGGQNYRWNPNTNALVATDTSLLYAPGDPQTGTPDVIGVAYSNNTHLATPTTMYAWDYNSDALITVGNVNGAPNSPNTGLSFTVFNPSPAFRTFNAGLDMDISGATGIAYVTHDDPATGTSMALYSIDLGTGAETLLGGYGPGVFVSSISVIPEPASLALIVVGLTALGLQTRRRQRS